MRAHSLLRLLPIVLLAAAAIFFSAPVRADAGQDAKGHFQRGVRLFEEQDYRAALIEFRRAYEAAPAFSVLFNVGQTSYQLLEYADALRALERYLQDGGAAVPASRRALVEKEIAELRDRVAQVTVRSNAEGAEIAVDDAAVGRTPLTAPLLVSAGRRKIALLTSGRAPVVRIVDVAGGDTLEVTLDVAIDPAAPPPVVTAAADAPPRAIAPPADLPRRDDVRRVSPLAYVGFGLAAVGVGVGATFGVLALGERSDLDQSCPSKQCGPSSQHAIDRLQRDATIATTGFVASGVGLATAVTALLLGGESSPPASAARVAPFVGVGSIGLRGAF